ncbi:Glycogenin-2 [Yarrowia sp. C11]|nr:Glycogenin-2 [Yarrowia sp. E02]KAG5365381.1 Glycogenin-2 [Yarrowia sp. C11]
MAYCTLLSSDNYLPGAIVLAHRLKTLDSSRDRLCLITKAVSPHVKQELAQYYSSVFLVDDILPYSDSSRAAQQLLGRPELGTTLAKIAVWNLTQYKHILFLDSDVLPLKDISVLFKPLENQSTVDKPVLVASPDVGWPDVFNSGVFATVPDQKVYSTLVELAQSGVSFDGGDQGLLNEYFREVSAFSEPSESDGSWIRAPFTFNVPANGAGVGSGVSPASGAGLGSGAAGYEPAYARFKDDVSAVHFLGPGNKPWMSSGNSFNDYHVAWNRAYNELYPFVKPSELADSLRNKRTIGADVNRWDPSTMPPPARGQGEAVKLQQTEFRNVWDGGNASETHREHHHHHHHRHHHRSGSHHHHHGSREAALPPPIFPWERRDRVVTRVFHDYVVHPNASFAAPEESHDDDDDVEYEYVEDDVVEVDGEVDDIVEGMQFSLNDTSEDSDEYTPSGGKKIAYPVTPFASIRGRRPTGLPGIAPEFEDDEEEGSEVVNDIRMRRPSEEEYGSNDEWDPSMKLEELRRASDRLSSAQTSYVPDDI